MRILPALLLLTLTSLAGATGTDAHNNWQHYLEKERDIAPAFRFPHAACFRAAALKYKLPETLLLAVARGESDFKETARSRANAHGVMQIQWPGTAKHLGINRLSELYDPCVNIDAGTRYLVELMDRYKGDLHLALAAYNYGPGRIAVDSQLIPEGAEWYSAYIYRHLDYVLGDRGATRNLVETLYSDLGRTTLLSFGEPYRAAAFVESLERSNPELQLDWFRTGVGEFSVVVLYGNKDEFQSSARGLASAGFPLSAGTGVAPARRWR